MSAPQEALAFKVVCLQQHVRRAHADIKCIKELAAELQSEPAAALGECLTADLVTEFGELVIAAYDASTALIGLAEPPNDRRRGLKLAGSTP